MTGIAENTVRRYLGGAKAADRTRATEQRDAAVQALREKGMTLRAIGETLSIGPKTVWAALFRHKRRMEKKVDRERLPHLTPEEARKLPVEALELSTRSLNLLRYASTVDVGELVRWTEHELLHEPNLGLSLQAASVGRTARHKPAAEEHTVLRHAEGWGAHLDQADVRWEQQLVQAELDRLGGGHRSGRRGGG